MKEVNNNHLGEKLETIGAVAAGLGIIGTCVSGILFIGSELNLNADEIQKLSQQVNVFFETGMASLIFSGAGIGVAKLGETIKTRNQKQK